MQSSRSARALRVLSLSPALILAACGGGDGGGTSAPNVAPAVQITADNQQAVAADAASNANAINGGAFAFLFGNLTPQPQQAAAVLAAGVQTQASTSATSGVVAALIRKYRHTGGASVAAGVQQAAACTTGSGTITQTDGSTDSNGNYSYSYSVVLNNCQTDLSGYGTVVMNGSMSYSDSGTEAENASTYSADFVAQNYTIQGANISASIDGAMHMAGNWDGVRDTSTTSGSRLSVSMSQPIVNNLALAITAAPTVRTVTLYNFSQTTTSRYDNTNNAQTSTLTTDAIVETNAFGATVSYHVTTPQQVVITNNVVKSGQAKTVGAKNASILVTVTSDDTVKLEADVNGDGTIDNTVPNLPAGDLLPRPYGFF